MQYGFFDDANREYVITTPRTPRPWINYLGTEGMFGLISNTGGGYAFHKDARLRRITRYRYNNVPYDGGGRYFYIREGDTVWNPGCLPVDTALDRYECRHGLGYTTIVGEKEGLRCTVCFFVPPGTDAEVHKVTFENLTDRPRSFSLFSFVEFCLWNALDDMTNFQHTLNIGEVEVDGSTIYHKTEYRERRNHYAFYSVNEAINGFDTERESFIGIYNGFHNPAAVMAGAATNSVAVGWNPVASHQLNINLAPGAKKDLVFVLGFVENDEDKKWESPGIINKDRARELIAKLSTVAQIDALLANLRSYWDSRLAAFAAKTGDARIDRMANIWNPYQCMITFNMSRSASYYESGIGRGMGFRDSNQDTLGFVHQIPDRVRERLLDIAATQLADGGAYHQYQPLTKRGNHEAGGNFNDDPLWLILSTASYIRETGDEDFLNTNVPFENNDELSAPMMEHLRRAFNHVLDNRGPHGLPLIGRADWNDSLNLNCYSTIPGESFQTTTSKDGRVAESVMIAGMFVRIGQDYVDLCNRRGMKEEASRAQGQIDTMQRVIMEHAWDGEWFMRAYDDAGAKVGSKENAEGQIYLEPQGWCVMAGIGLADGAAEKALDSAAKHLETPHGMVLLYPAYKSYHLNLGEIGVYPPGYKENGAIFCHSNPWMVIAETVLGRGDRAFSLWQKMAPAYREEISELHLCEPYFYAQVIEGKEGNRPGSAKNSVLTGTASWTFVSLSQWILGVRPDYDGLRIDPCIPKAWDGFSIERQFRGTRYFITVKNPDHVSKGVFSVKVDGSPIQGNLVKHMVKKDGVRVEVILG